MSCKGLHDHPNKSRNIDFSSFIEHLQVRVRAIFEAMNTIESLQPVTSAFQLLGLSVAQFSTLRNLPLHCVIKCYSLLLIAIRFAIFCFVLLKYELPAERDKITSVIYASVMVCSYLRETSILIEAFFKARQEEAFMGNFVEIDDTLMRHFDVDLKMNELRKSAFKQLIIWTCIIGIESIYHLQMHYDTGYFPHEFICTLSQFTASFVYFQTVTWAGLIRYRLHLVNRIINKLKCEHNEKIENRKSNKPPQISNTSNESDEYMACTDQIEIANESISDVDDAHVSDQLCTLCDLYNRLWLQTNRLNERFKFSMVLNIGHDFAYLVAQLYYIFTCLRKINTCQFIATDIVTCLINTFHLSMLSRAGQNVADEALQVAYEIHRNKFIRCSMKLNSFVRLNCFIGIGLNNRIKNTN